MGTHLSGRGSKPGGPSSFRAGEQGPRLPKGQGPSGDPVGWGGARLGGAERRYATEWRCASFALASLAGDAEPRSRRLLWLRNPKVPRLSRVDLQPLSDLALETGKLLKAIDMVWQRVLELLKGSASCCERGCGPHLPLGLNVLTQ